MLAFHTGIIESNEVDLEEEPELFALFLSSFATSSFADIGFNSKTGFFNPCNVDDTVTRHLDVELEKCTLDNNQGTQPCLQNACLGEKMQLFGARDRRGSREMIYGTKGHLWPDCRP